MIFVSLLCYFLFQVMFLVFRLVFNIGFVAIILFGFILLVLFSLFCLSLKLVRFIILIVLLNFLLRQVFSEVKLISFLKGLPKCLGFCFQVSVFCPWLSPISRPFFESHIFVTILFSPLGGSGGFCQFFKVGATLGQRTVTQTPPRCCLRCGAVLAITRIKLHQSLKQYRYNSN